MGQNDSIFVLQTIKILRFFFFSSLSGRYWYIHLKPMHITCKPKNGKPVHKHVHIALVNTFGGLCWFSLCNLGSCVIGCDIFFFLLLFLFLFVVVVVFVIFS